MFTVPIRDLVVLITGTGKKNGIGRALVKEALKRGARKVYATARDRAQLEDLERGYPSQVVPLELDVTNYDQIQNIAKVASDTQVLVNNAGACAFSGCLSNYNETLARYEMEVNYMAPFRLINAFSKGVIRNGSGAIVNIISIGGLYPSPVHATYSASKAALYSLTQALRIEMKINFYDIPVFGVYPGPVDTDLAANLNVKKAHPKAVAKRVFDGMEQGILDIMTDELSDHFTSYIKKDTKVIEELKKAFSM